MGNPELQSHEPEELINPALMVGDQTHNHKIDTMQKAETTRPLDKNWTVKEMEPFFEGVNDKMGCIDGRVFDTMGLAGSGILLDRDPATDLPKQEYMDRFVALAKEGKLKTITWHAGHGGCGAAKLFLKKKKGVKNPTDDQAAEVAEDFSTRLAKKIFELSGVKINVEEAPAHGDHEEGGVYLDNTDKLDLETHDHTKQLPNGFMMNPLLTNDPNYVWEEIKVAITIAFGDHGKHKKKPFTEENPFFIKWTRNPKQKLDPETEAKWKDFGKMVRNKIEADEDLAKIATNIDNFYHRIGDVEVINAPF